jgi:hypothetical protein
MKNELKALLEKLDEQGDENPSDVVRELIEILIDGLKETDRIIEEFKIKAEQAKPR